ncbi:MAG: hypothetical protein EP338_09990 [Bacteroidetes bacterium]|nr:MAG: hypothetical protein EP338_09990 [Bacteroidota bacterium]
MKHSVFFLLLICTYQIAHSQKISGKEFQKEIDLTALVLTDVHANPFAFQTEEGLNKLKDSVLQEYNFQDSILILDAFQCYANLVSSIKCAHSGAYRTKKLDSTINEFPLKIKVIKGNGLIAQNYPELNLFRGDQVVSINGISWKSVFEKGKKLHSSDGDSPLNAALFERRCKLDIPIILGNPVEFKVVTLHDGAMVESHFDASSISASEPKCQGFDFTLVGDEKKIGLIRVFNFPGDEKSIADFEKFCKKTRNKLERKKIKDVIIDIRDNGGGDRIDLLLRNFTPTSFKLMSSTIDTVGLAKYSMDLIFHGTTYENVLKTPTKSEPSRQVDFQGDLYLDINLYVLVNGRTASAASHFASLVKEHNLGKIVGTETGGRASGCNGNVYCSYFLPYSGIELYFPLMVNTYAIDQIENPNHGVFPDIFIEEELSDDLELTNLIEIINEHNMH